ncbi:MAG: CpcT/CpeT family chromophore lyase [Chitinophagaceae bacterium]
MMRWCLIIIFLPLFGRAQKFTAADLRQLKLYSTGFFSNDVQVKADTHVISSGLKIQPIWQKRKDGIWMFTERTDTGHHYQVWHFYLQDDTTLVMQFLDFKEVQKAVQISSDVKQQSNLYLYNLFTRHGCEVYLKKNETGYAGRSLGKDCSANIAGIEYIMFNIALTKNTIDWRQAGYDKEDKELPSAVTGNYKFIKHVKSLK